MHPVLKIIPNVSWLFLSAYWLWSARKTKMVSYQENFLKRVLSYWLPLIVAVLLLGPGEWFGHSLLREQFVPHSDLIGGIGGVCCLVGLLIACNARYCLGKNWSLSVQLKERHELITSGPYRYVRHPIYTGLLLLFTGNALVVGDWRGVLAVVIIFVSLWLKLRTEERWLSNYFGVAYINYKAKTNAIIPWLL